MMLRKVMWIAGGGIVLIGVVVATWWGAQLLMATPQHKLTHVSQTIARLSECTGKNFGCYASYLRARTINAEPKMAFADLRQAYETDAVVRQQCHELAHVIGEAAFEKYGSVAEATAHGDGMCQAGYYHGLEEAAAGHDKHE